MSYQIALYSPDQHVVYDGQTPDERGIGGGVTARVRLLRAFAQLGHQVTAYVNCETPGNFAGVEYRRFQDTDRVESDIFIAITTGGKLDLSPVSRLHLNARLRIVWVQEVPRLAGLERVAPDFVYVASNFLRTIVVNEWGVSASQTFVCYNGLEQELFAQAAQNAPSRDPFAVVYLGSPSKGLSEAIRVIRALREHDPRFHLDVYGSGKIWGQAEQIFENEPGVRFCGLVGQRQLIPQLFGYGFCLAPQGIPEGFGIAVQEAKRAGILVIASRVGAYAELIHDGYDGFLIEENYATDDSLKKIIETVRSLISQTEYADYVRRNAMATPWDWRQAAQTWVGHWDTILKGDKALTPPTPTEAINYACPKCRVSLLVLADGRHCTSCGRYFPSRDGIQCFAEGSAYYGEITQPEFRQLLGAVSAGSWRQAVARQFETSSPFLHSYILDQSRGYFHFLFDLSSESRVLDLGAGYGTIAASIAQRCQVIAVDNTFLRLGFLRERCRQNRLQNVILVYGDALELPFEPEQFDLITMVGLLEWAGTARPEPDPEELQRWLLREAYRTLKPGGCLYIGIENRYGFKYLLGEPDDHTGVVNITHISRRDADAKFQDLRGNSYRVRTHSRDDYECILRQVGFQRLKYYSPYPDYRLWSALVPLESAEIVQFYLDYLQDDLPAGSRAQQVQILERVAGQLGHLAHYANSYAILAWK